MLSSMTPKAAARRQQGAFRVASRFPPRVYCPTSAAYPCWQGVNKLFPSGIIICSDVSCSGFMSKGCYFLMVGGKVSSQNLSAGCFFSELAGCFGNVRLPSGKRGVNERVVGQVVLGLGVVGFAVSVVDQAPEQIFGRGQPIAG